MYLKQFFRILILNFILHFVENSFGYVALKHNVQGMQDYISVINSGKFFSWFVQFKFDGLCLCENLILIKNLNLA